MVLQALRKHRPSIEALGSWKRRVEMISKALNETTSNRISHKTTSGNKMPQKEEQWTIEQLQDSSSSMSAPDLGHAQEIDGASQLQTVVDKVQSVVTESIPQISSRILHAASSIFHELSRGHFLPFLTVAIACLGRIYSILLQMGRETLSSLKESNVKCDGNMDSLFEVTHDELAKKMNAVVDNLRWKDAVRRFKMGKGLSKIVSESIVLSNTPGDQCISNSPSVLANEASCVNDDPGEIVGAASTKNDQRDSKLFGQDDSLADSSMEEHISACGMVKYDHETGDMLSTLEKQTRKKKKKKRKDKKKKKSDIDSIFIDIDSDGNKEDNSKEDLKSTKQKVKNSKKRKGCIIDDIFS